MSPPQCAELSVLDVLPFGRGRTARTFALRLSPPPWNDYTPGQFVMLRSTDWGPELPWARPFSISRAGERGLTCFIQVAGRGTQRLSALQAGDAVRVWGPLGNGFAVEADSPTLLLAGGVGIAPFIGYAHTHPKPGNVSMLFGHRAPLDCYPADDIRGRIGFEAMHEKSPEDLEHFIAAMRARMEEHAGQRGLALACGPPSFLRTVQELAARTGLRTQISLESRMACGVGACLGCVVTTTDAWPVPDTQHWPVQTCTCGPVFWAGHVVLD
jgi:dihydroorotate dehydrogenase electron transfer subunit